MNDFCWIVSIIDGYSVDYLFFGEEYFGSFVNGVG